MLPILALLEERCRARTEFELDRLYALWGLPFGAAMNVFLNMGSRDEQLFRPLNPIEWSTRASAFNSGVAAGALRGLHAFDLTKSAKPPSVMLEASGMRAISSTWSHLPHLVTLGLSHNGVGDGNVSSLATQLALGALPKLAYLGLDCNLIGDDGARRLAHVAGCSSAPSASAPLEYLKRLSVHDNLIGDTGMRDLGDFGDDLFADEDEA